MTKNWMFLNIKKYSLYYFTNKEFLKSLDFENFNISTNNIISVELPMYCWMFERDWVSCYLIGFLSVYEFWHVLDAGDEENANEIRTKNEKGNMRAGVNQHLWPVHHPLDACPNSVVDELQLS